MKKTLLRSKLHRINVTQVELDYEGSCAVDLEILAKGNMQEYEKIDIYDVTNGERLTTYAIPGPADSAEVCVNGACCHKINIHDEVIICSYATLNEDEIENHHPTIIYLDKKNSITDKMV